MSLSPGTGLTTEGQQTSADVAGASEQRSDSCASAPPNTDAPGPNFVLLTPVGRLVIEPGVQVDSSLAPLVGTVPGASELCG
jgi:hypothetical protein